MTDFTIPCATFVRLASVVEGYQPSAERAELLSVNIRHLNGRVIALATNSKIAAIEFLGVVDLPNSEISIVVDQSLVEQCKTETAFGGLLTVQTNDILQFATAKTTLGYNHPTNAAIWGAVPGNFAMRILENAAAFKQPAKSSKVMHWYLDAIATLAGSSPSGRIFFPKNFNADGPVILRDPIDPNWCGLFIPQMNPTDEAVEEYQSATVPDWLV